MLMRVLTDVFRWHQDVKPDNILVKSSGIDSPYDWKFKLSDLGLSHFKRESQDGSDFDAYGTETYGKPSARNIKFFL
jgi:serine/threonine protein kinase